MATVTVYNEDTGTNWTINVTMEQAVVNGSGSGTVGYYIKVATSQRADGEAIPARIITDLGTGVGESGVSLSSSFFDSDDSGLAAMAWGVTDWVNQAIVAILGDSNESASSSSLGTSSSSQSSASSASSSSSSSSSSS